MTPHRQIHFGAGYGSCFATAIASVLDMDLGAVPNFAAFGPGTWFDALLLWAKSAKVHVDRVFPGDDMPPGPVVAGGVGPRGPRHCVVWQDGKMLHDPHPSDAGLVGDPDHYFAFSRCPGEECTRCAERRQRPA